MIGVAALMVAQSCTGRSGSGTETKCSGRRLLYAMAVCLAGLLPTGVTALQPELQGRIDVWGMPRAVTDDFKVSIEVRDTSTGTSRASDSADAGLHFGAGVRAMTWFARQPAWVTGLDIGYLRASGDAHEVEVQPLSVFIGVQHPHTSDSGLRPYFLAGMTTFSAWGRATAGTLSSSFRKTDWWIDGTDNLSPYLTVGTVWSVSPGWSLLLEARRQRFSFRDVKTNSIILPTRNVFTDVSLDVSGLALGIVWTPDARY